MKIILAGAVFCLTSPIFADEQAALKQLTDVSGVELQSVDVPAPAFGVPVLAADSFENQQVQPAEQRRVIIQDNKVGDKPLTGNALPPRADEKDVQWDNNAQYVIVFKAKTAGVSMAGASIKLSFNYGGKYKGRGLYIGGIEVMGDKAHSLLGKKLTAVAELPASSVRNCGSQNHPVASIDLMLTFSTTPIVWGDEAMVFKYELRGDGTLLNPSGKRLSPGATDVISY